MIIFPYGDINPRRTVPFINYLLIIANIGAFIMLFPRSDYEKIIYQWGFVPAHFSFVDILTSMFLHAGYLHIFFNMLFLWICGDNVEDRIGHFTYLMFYILCGLGAGIIQGVMTADPVARTIPCIGASGAVSGVLGAYFFIFPQSQIKFFYFFFVIVGTFTLPSILAIGFWFVRELIPALAGVQAGIAHWAHVGGFAAGLIIAIFLVATGQAKRRRRDVKVDW